MSERQKLAKNYWKNKTLAELTREEWEALCDGCGRCCLHKIEDEDTGEVFYTRIACKLLDLDSCRCKDYANRRFIVPDCMVLTPENVQTFAFLPSTCAYRLLAEGGDLKDWHPLISGRQETVVEAGVSICGLAIPESADVLNHIVDYVMGAFGQDVAKSETKV